MFETNDKLNIKLHWSRSKIPCKILFLKKLEEKKKKKGEGKGERQTEGWRGSRPEVVQRLDRRIPGWAIRSLTVSVHAPRTRHSPALRGVSAMNTVKPGGGQRGQPELRERGWRSVWKARLGGGSPVSLEAWDSDRHWDVDTERGLWRKRHAQKQNQVGQIKLAFPYPDETKACWALDATGTEPLWVWSSRLRGVHAVRSLWKSPARVTRRKRRFREGNAWGHQAGWLQKGQLGVSPWCHFCNEDVNGNKGKMWSL